MMNITVFTSNQPRHIHLVKSLSEMTPEKVKRCLEDRDLSMFEKPYIS